MPRRQIKKENLADKEIVINKEDSEQKSSVKNMEDNAKNKIDDKSSVMPKNKKGVVVDCVLLNVREAPKATSNVKGIIAADSEVTIIEKESTDEWFKIHTSSGVDGFCLKKFIAIKQ